MSDPHDEPDGAHADRSGTDEIEYCAHCGTKLPDDVWCPIRTDTDADGTVRLRSFCDETCREAWVADGSTTSDQPEDR